MGGMDLVMIPIHGIHDDLVRDTHDTQRTLLYSSTAKSKE
jgi:hypothetical protein